MSNIVRIPAAATLPAAVGDYQAQNNLLYAFGLWGMQAYPLDLANNKVVKGAIFNVGGVLYKASSDETITGTPSNYVKLTPISAGAQCSAAYVANLSGVSWSDTYNGYVDVSGNLYLFDELLAVKNGAITTPKTFIGRIGQAVPHGSQTITSGSGNFTVPAGVYSIKVTLIGGGGGGGGTVSGNSAGGAGGGGGGISMATLSVTPGQTISYSVGAAGSAGAATAAGGNGGDTTFTGVTTATGGGGGSPSTPPGAAGSGNFGSRGAGTPGGGSTGGTGGSGGRGGTINVPGSAAPVGGGGGGAGLNSQPGGAGGSGIIFVEW